MFKKYFLLLLVLNLLAALALTACAPSGAANTAPADAISVVENYYDAYNDKKIDEAISYIADDALFINPTGTYEGKAEIEKHLQGIRNEGLSFELSDFKDQDGRVVYAYKVLINGEVVETGTGGLTIVKNGKIVFDGTEATEPKQ
jgi:hypothetical protein